MPYPALLCQSRAILGMRRFALTLGCAALCACATPFELPHLEASDDPRIDTSELIAGDGVTLPLRSWVPARKPKAVIVALHGFNDYSNAFEGPGQYFKANDIALYAYDQRGFGAADGHGLWAGEKNLTEDLRYMVEAAKEKHPQTPVYLLGESMGGAVAISALSQDDFPEVDGAILSAPAVWGSETMNGFYQMTLWMLAHTMPAGQVTGQGLEIQASDNIEMLRALGRDPLIIKETRIDAIYGIVSLMDSAYSKVDQVQTPMLMLYGAKDQVIPKDPVKNAVAKMKAPYRGAYYPEGYHMLLRDLKAGVVLGDIGSWIAANDAPFPSGYDEEWQQRLAEDTQSPVDSFPSARHIKVSGGTP